MGRHRSILFVDTLSSLIKKHGSSCCHHALSVLKVTNSVDLYELNNKQCFPVKQLKILCMSKGQGQCGQKEKMKMFSKAL